MADLILPENNGDLPDLSDVQNQPYVVDSISGIYLKTESFSDVTTEKYHPRINVTTYTSPTPPTQFYYYDSNNNFQISTYAANNHQSGYLPELKDLGVSTFLTNDFKILSVLNFPEQTNKLRYFYITLRTNAQENNVVNLFYKVISIAPNSNSNIGRHDYVAKIDLYQSFVKYKVEPNIKNLPGIVPERASAIVNPYTMENYLTGEYEPDGDINIIPRGPYKNYGDLYVKEVPKQYIDPHNTATPPKRNVFSSKAFNLDTDVDENYKKIGVVYPIAGVYNKYTPGSSPSFFTDVTQYQRDTVSYLKPLVLYPAALETDTEGKQLIDWNQKLISKPVTPELFTKKTYGTTMKFFGTTVTGNNVFSIAPEPKVNSGITYKSTMKSMVAVINDRFYAFPLGTFTFQLESPHTAYDEYVVFNDEKEIEHIAINPNIKNLVFALNPSTTSEFEPTATNIYNTYIQQNPNPTIYGNVLAFPNNHPTMYEEIDNVLTEGFLGYYDIPVTFNTNFVPLTFVTRTTTTINYKSLVGWELAPDALTRLNFIDYNNYENDKREVFTNSSVTYDGSCLENVINDTITSKEYNFDGSTNIKNYYNSLYNFHNGTTFSELHIPEHLLNQVNPIFIDRIYLTMYTNYNNQLKILAPVERGVETNYNKLQAQITNQINYDNSVNNLVYQQNLAKRSIALSKDQAEFQRVTGHVSNAVNGALGLAGAGGSFMKGDFAGGIGGLLGGLFNTGMNAANIENSYHVANIQRGIAEDTLKNQMAENTRNNETNKKLIAASNKFTPVTQVEKSVKHITNPYAYILLYYDYYDFGWLAQYKHNASAKREYFMHRLNNGYAVEGYKIPNASTLEYNGNQDNIGHYYLSNNVWDTFLSTSSYVQNDTFFNMFFYDDILDFCKNGWASGKKLWWNLNEVVNHTF